MLNRRSGVAEVVIPPRSQLAGDRVFPGMVTESGDLAVLAVRRRGDDIGATALVEGDTLLLQGTWAALDRDLDDPEVLVVDAPELVRRQAVPLGPGAKTGAGRARRDGARAGDGRDPARGRRAAGGERDDRAARADGRAGAARRVVDDGRARRRDDVAVDGDGRHGRGGAARRRAGGRSSATSGRTRCCSGCSS